MAVWLISGFKFYGARSNFDLDFVFVWNFAIAYPDENPKMLFSNVNY